MEARYANDDLQKALEVLKSGGIILYPTDTVWGLGCDATNAAAVKKIHDLKKRPATKQMLVLVDAPSRLTNYIQEVPALAWEIIDLTTKPLTIVYSGAKNLPESLITNKGSVAIRVTNELFSQTLCSRLKKPIVSTSANYNSKPTPRNFSEIDESIVKAVDYVVQYRQDDANIHSPSGIIELGIHGEIKVIRE
jgi:L-threonylcarbamoyladenylate synthase